MSISPFDCGEGLTVMYFVFSWKRPRKVDEVALDEAQTAQILQLRLAESQRAKRLDFIIDGVNVRHQIDAGIAALEAIFDAGAGKMMQHHLHHRELVQIRVQQRR